MQPPGWYGGCFVGVPTETTVDDAGGGARVSRTEWFVRGL
jgi:hypothetical protein